MKNKLIKLIVIIIACVCGVSCTSSSHKYTADCISEENCVNADDTFDVYSFIAPSKELIFYHSKNKCNIIYCNL